MMSTNCIAMATALIYDDRFLAHDTGTGHPERSDRLRAITGALHDNGLWERLEHLPFEPADGRTIERVHEGVYVARLQAACQAGQPFIDTPDSAICPRSHDVARLAVGGLLAAADAVVNGRVQNAFCAVRPPGHHAEADRSMGFCLFNHAAIAADDLIVSHGLERVAVVDFDVHHGNGTQHIFEHRDDVLFVSLHEHPHFLYPGTGFESETGTGPGRGFTVNVPLAPRGGDEAYRHAFNSHVLPALDRFRPQAMIVSAGFDAAVEDPLAHMQVTADGFEWMTRQLVAAAQHHCDGRLISTLEGGYDLQSLAHNVCRHVKTLLDAGAGS